MPLFGKKSKSCRSRIEEQGSKTLLETDPFIEKALSKTLSDHEEDVTGYGQKAFTMEPKVDMRHDVTASFKTDINDETREGVFINSIVTSSESTEDGDDVSNISCDLATVDEDKPPLMKYVVDHVLGCIDFWEDCAVAVHETDFNTTLFGNDESPANDRSLYGSMADDTALRVEPTRGNTCHDSHDRSLFNLFDELLMDEESAVGLATKALPTETIGTADDDTVGTTEVNTGDTIGTLEAKTRENAGTAEIKGRETTTGTAKVKARETNAGTVRETTTGTAEVKARETNASTADINARKTTGTVLVESHVVHNTIPNSTYETVAPRGNDDMVAVLAEIDKVIDSQVALLCRPCCAPVEAASDLSLVDGAEKKPDYENIRFT